MKVEQMDFAEWCLDGGEERGEPAFFGGLELFAKGDGVP